MKLQFPRVQELRKRQTRILSDRETQKPVLQWDKGKDQNSLSWTSLRGVSLTPTPRAIRPSPLVLQMTQSLPSFGQLP